MQVAIYKRSEKGYYRWRTLDLIKLLTSHTEDEKIKAYRKTKTKKMPKGDQELKKKIKAYMPSGDYGVGVPRSKSSVLAIETGLVQLDFDLKVDRKVVEKIFAAYEFIAVAGVSCGGEGFYLLVQTPSAEDYEEYWQALSEYFEKETGYHVDPAVSSVNEIRYLSLTTDVMVRESPKVWKKKKKKEVSKFEGKKVPHDSILIQPDTFGLHYFDLISLAGLNNSNGTPLETVQQYFQPSMFAKDSHLSKLDQGQLATIIERVYQRYEDQHGEAIVPLLLTDHKVTLPPLDIPPDAKQKYIVLLLIKNIFESYMLKTDAKTKITYRFTGTYWQETPDHELRNFLTSCAMVSRVDNRLPELTEFRDLMLQQLKDTTSVTFETPQNMFNLNNGVLIFANGEVTLVEHSSDYLFTYILDYDYLPKSKPSKLLESFLARTIPDSNSLNSFFQYVGSSFSDIRMELFLIILGGGANGKSTLINLLGSCLGGAVGRFSLDNLTDSTTDKAEKEARNIYNKILAVDSESGRIKDPRQWRKIISKEPISVKFLYKDTFETTNYARLISCMNETPYIDTLEGSARRIIAIQTGKSLRREEYDLELDKKLHAERSSMLNRIVDGYKVFHEQGGVINISDESRLQTDEILEEYNFIIKFMKAKRYMLLPFPVSTSTKTTRVEKHEQENAEHFAALLREGVEARVEQVKLLEMYQAFRDYCKDDEGILENKIYSKALFTKKLKTLTKLPYSPEASTVQSYQDKTRAEYYIFGRYKYVESLPKRGGKR